MTASTIPAPVYCTYFDSAYLARGIAMLRSLRRYNPDAIILVLALDDLSESIVLEQFATCVRVIGTAELHTVFPALAKLRDQRSAWAYYATHKPALARYAMDRVGRAASVMYIDADTWFFGSISPIREEIAQASVALSPHRFHSTIQHLAIFGTYNAGFIYWRNDPSARQCLSDWYKQCLEWCAEEPQPDGRFMNQGYLNRWPEQYPGVHIIRHPGANLAPWNIDAHSLALDGETVTVDSRPLIFYHFHGIGRDADGQWCSYFPHLDRQLDLALQAVYRPYLAAVEAEGNYLMKTHGISGTGPGRSKPDWSPALRLGRG